MSQRVTPLRNAPARARRENEDVKKNVLLILPDTGQAQTLATLLDQSGGYETRSVRMPAEFADAIVSFRPDLVIMDEQLPADDMQAWTRVITALSPETRLLDVSSHSDESRRLELSAHGYLCEPFQATTFLEEVRRVLAAEPTHPHRHRLVGATGGLVSLVAFGGILEKR